jgi:thiamine-monophosphate kinase
MGEFDLIARIREAASGNGNVVLGIGDDCAILKMTPGYELLVTTDMLMDGRHFVLGQATPEQIGRKALGVNLSDIAAMAGMPVAAVVAVALPRNDADQIADGLQAGIQEMASRFGVSLVGGDTNAWDGPLVISITVIGEAKPGRAVRRSGAKPGDAIFVTGPLGGSLLCRHLDVRPRIREAQLLVSAANVHAMIDISDGLLSDLSHILEESGRLGAILDSSEIPIHADAYEMSTVDGGAPLDHALNDGEDFELLFTASFGDYERLLAVAPALRRIGEVIDTPNLLIRDTDGRKSPIIPSGFDHLR